jgi:hypothetical protein
MVDARPSALLESTQHASGLPLDDPGRRDRPRRQVDVSLAVSTSARDIENLKS